jgi:type I restriction enzyme S subunit
LKTQTIDFRWLAEEVDKRNSTDLDYPLMSVSQTKGVIPRSELMGNDGRAESLDNYKVCLPGQIVINRMSASSGALGLTTQHGLVSPDYAVLAPTSLVDPKYLDYLMRSKWFVGEMVSRLRGIGAGGESAGVRTPRINISDLKDVAISLPSIEEQRRIADFLEVKNQAIDDLMALKASQIEAYIAIHDTRKNEIIWNNEKAKLTPLRYLVKCNKKSLGSDTSLDFNFAYCDVGSVNFRTGISESLERFNFLDAPSRARRLAKTGDVIFSMVRPYLRAVAIVPQFEVPCVFSTAFAVLESTTMEPEYLFEVLTTTMFLSEAERWSSGMGYPAINQDDLLKIRVPFLETSNQSVRTLQLSEERLNSMSLIKTLEDSIKALSEYKTALITDAVTGSFDVTTSWSTS